MEGPVLNTVDMRGEDISMFILFSFRLAFCVSHIAAIVSKHRSLKQEIWDAQEKYCGWTPVASPRAVLTRGLGPVGDPVRHFVSLLSVCSFRLVQK